MQNDVPYFSQYATDISSDWQQRACGVVALRMGLAVFLDTENLPSSQELIEKGVEIGAYDPRFGWRHDGLVALAQSYGISAMRDEFKNEGGFEKGIVRIKECIKRKRVPIVSVIVNDSKDTHLVPLVGYNNEGFFYHDPAQKNSKEKKAHQHMKFLEFERRWRRLAVFVG